MTNLVHQKKSTKLLNDVVDLSRKSEPSEFQLKRFKQEAENIKKHDAACGYLVLGMIAALQHDAESMISNHEAALKLEPYDPISLANYGISLNRLYYFGDAATKIKKANELNSWTNISHICNFIEFCINAGRLSEALEGAEKANKICPEEEFPHDTFINSARKLIESLKQEETDVLYASAPQIIELATNIARDKKIKVTSCDIDIKQDESSEWFSWIFDTNLNVDDSIDLNIALCDALANQENKISDKVVIRYL
jgi:tetratricopeptide (TPR) repeat protein